jgi:predicted AAA+ superfamily ATPase
VRERVAARSSQPLRQLVQMVFESAGSEMSLRRLAGATGVAVETTQSHLEACEAAYLVFGVPFFAWSERARATHPKKYYPVDTGLRRVVVTRTGADVGKHLECATFLALRQRYGAVSYWRGDGEVDFVVQRDDGVAIPVQVSLGGAQPRHHRALERFYEQFPQAGEAVVVDEENFVQLARGELIV